MQNSPELIRMVLQTQPDDFLYYPKDSEEWQEIEEFYELVDLETNKTYKSFDHYKDNDSK